MNCVIKKSPKIKDLTSIDLTSEANLDAIVSVITEIIKNKQVNSLSLLLPILLKLRGEPYSLVNNQDPTRSYVMMDPMFRFNPVPIKMIWKCGRQVSKTTTLAAAGVCESITQPHLASLYVAPLFSQASRLSSQYIAPFIYDSPIRNIIQNKTTINNVNLRTFSNGSKMYFSYAFLSTDRVRGISADQLKVDEVQDMDVDFLPIIEQCISASRYGELVRYTGTPKTLDNTIQALWEQSSQAEWVIPCDCGHWNIPCIQEDLKNMILPEGLSCSKCKRLVNPLHPKAHWRHMRSRYKEAFAGYHLPQVILPLHYLNSNKWYNIYYKFQHQPPNIFLNEVLGESSDTGERLLSLKELKAASTNGKNTVDAQKAKLSNYVRIIMGVDWGGYAKAKNARGADSQRLLPSYTSIAVTGLTHNGKCECIHAKRFNKVLAYGEEVNWLMEIYKQFSCSAIAHDYGGSGADKEVLLIQAGFNMRQIVPFHYVRATNKPVIRYIPPDNSSPRHYYSLDKARSLRITVTGIQTGHVTLPEYEPEGVTEDLLALIQEKRETAVGADVMLVTRDPNHPDDFAHALNYTCQALWYLNGRWPDFAQSLLHGAAASIDEEAF